MENNPFNINNEEVKMDVDRLREAQRLEEQARLCGEYAGNLAVTHFDILHDIVANPDEVEGLLIEMTPEEANRAFTRENEQMSLEDERGWTESSKRGNQ